jgi:hypothetical protein
MCHCHFAKQNARCEAVSDGLAEERFIAQKAPCDDTLEVSLPCMCHCHFAKQNALCEAVSEGLVEDRFTVENDPRDDISEAFVIP